MEYGEWLRENDANMERAASTCVPTKKWPFVEADDNRFAHLFGSAHGNPKRVVWVYAVLCAHSAPIMVSPFMFDWDNCAECIRVVRVAVWTFCVVIPAGRAEDDVDEIHEACSGIV